MKNIEKLYLTEKEAAYRYGLSRAWFQRSRWNGEGPNFIKVTENGRVLYPLKETDEWFAQKRKSTLTRKAEVKKEFEELYEDIED